MKKQHAATGGNSEAELKKLLLHLIYGENSKKIRKRRASFFCFALYF